MTNKQDHPPPAQELKPELFVNESRIHPPAVRIKRSRETFTYFYTILGFALTIETGIIAMIDPLPWTWKLVTLAVVGWLTFHLIMDCAWLQERLVRIKRRYEEKFRP